MYDITFVKIYITWKTDIQGKRRRGSGEMEAEKGKRRRGKRRRGESYEVEA